jgi:hypothetical protein
MPAAQLSLVAVIYVFVQYFLARGAISRIMEADSSYAGRWAKPTFLASGRNSGAILYIMFNMNLPKDNYPGSLQLRIWVARVMLWLWPVVIFLILFFLPHRAP